VSSTASEPPPFSLEQARLLLAEQPFCRWWGFEVVGLSDGFCSLRLPLRPDLIRPGGVLHGSGYEAVADVAAWIAIMTKVGYEPMAVTAEMKTSFLRGATTDVTSEATVLRLGRRVAFIEARTFDASGALCAHSTLTYSRATGGTAPTGT
jgi:acyl-CoA thioesterase